MEPSIGSTTNFERVLGYIQAQRGQAHDVGMAVGQVDRPGSYDSSEHRVQAHMHTVCATLNTVRMSSLDLRSPDMAWP